MVSFFYFDKIYICRIKWIISVSIFFCVFIYECIWVVFLYRDLDRNNYGDGLGFIIFFFYMEIIYNIIMFIIGELCWVMVLMLIVLINVMVC